MIPELMAYAALCVAVIIVVACLAESGTLEDYAERRHVDKLADRSRNRKPAEKRNSRWARIGFRGLNV